LFSQGLFIPNSISMINAITCVEGKWRRLRGFNDLAKVITGITCKDGVEVTDVDQITA